MATNRLHISPEDLAKITTAEPGGKVLISNHADEADPRVCLELSRLSGKRFIHMCNREAFDEHFGLAGWLLQRLGHFSVERGAHDQSAKEFAIETIEHGREVLVVFPEGEIFYLNDEVQPFHSGAVELGMQAVKRKRTAEQAWTAHIIPMAIKYHHGRDIDKVLEVHVARMERQLQMTAELPDLAKRVRAIQLRLLEREENRFNLSESFVATGMDSGERQRRDQNMSQEIGSARRELLERVESKHKDLDVRTLGSTVDQAWNLGAKIRQELASQKYEESRLELESDISTLREVVELASWRPNYYSNNQSTDRLAEAVMKLEREMFGWKRPRQLGRRDVFVKVGSPIDLGHYMAEYNTDPKGVRHRVSEALQKEVQGLVKRLSEVTAIN